MAKRLPRDEFVANFEKAQEAKNFNAPNILQISSEVNNMLTQKEKDNIRFLKRAAVKDKIIAEMASENLERVRNGTWTVQQLIGLTMDTELKNLLADINTFSYEIAYSKVNGLTNSILTQDIKDGWKSKLYANFYL